MKRKMLFWPVFIALLSFISFVGLSCKYPDLTYEAFTGALEIPGGVSLVTISYDPNDGSKKIIGVTLKKYLYEVNFPLEQEVSDKLEQAKVSINTITKELTYKGFYAKLEKPGEVISVLIEENNSSDSGTIIGVKLKDGISYPVKFPLFVHPGLLEKLEELGVEIKTNPPPSNGVFSSAFSFLLPLFLIFVLIYFWQRRASNQQINGAKSFAGSKNRLTHRKPKERFDDVAGAEEAKQELKEIVDFLQNSQKFITLGARIPKGVLLMGPPGTGKTLVARAVAGEAGVPFFRISGSEFVEMFVGVGAARVRDLFGQAKKSAPCIIFIDEIDAVGRRRGAGVGGGHDEREQTLNQILVEMDGFDQETNIIVLAATNRPDILDPALLRPGRFDRQVILDKPDIEGRKAILKVHAKDKPLAKDVDLGTLAKETPGFTGADLENVLNEAAILAGRFGKTEISMKELDEAIDRVIAGPEKKSRIISPKEKEIITIHEAGHALVAHNIPHAEKVYKISCISRGLAAGYTKILPEEDRILFTKLHLEAELATLLGGRVAEEFIFGKDSITTGAANDLERATVIARKMVTEYGMSEKLGLRTFGKKEGLVFLGKDIAEERNYSDKIAELIDEEVKEIIDKARKTAKETLESRKSKLEKLSEALLREETLDGEHLQELLNK